MARKLADRIPGLWGRPFALGALPIAANEECEAVARQPRAAAVSETLADLLVLGE